MGNAALSTRCKNPGVIIYDDIDGGSNSEGRKVVTVLKRDGTVMDFDKEITVSKLLKDFPAHFVCNTEELGSGAKARMLTPKTLLKRGKVYLVVPQQQRKNHGKSKINPVVASTKGDSEPSVAAPAAEENEGARPARCESIKLVMTKQQLAKMIADGSILMAASQAAAAQDVTGMRTGMQTSVGVNITTPGLSYSSMRLFNTPMKMHSSSGSFKKNWHPVLDSIREVPTQ